MFKKIYFIILIGYPSVAHQAKETQGPAKISEYHPLFLRCYDEHDNLLIAIRGYRQNNMAFLLLVNPNTFETKVSRTNHITCRTLMSLTPYTKAIKKYSQAPYKLMNYGVIKSACPINGMVISVDLCPSNKPMEKQLFESLIALSEKLHRPIPVAISISGKWLLRHLREFNWLLSQQRQNKLAITWINHSFSHIYYPKVPYRYNFMLMRASEFDQEILKTEKLLLQHGQLPSVFFRFPGLISDKALVIKLRRLSLIPVGSNAWLAKGERASAGSIILIHGNSNEPKGIKTILPLLNHGLINWLSLTDMLKCLR